MKEKVVARPEKSIQKIFDEEQLLMKQQRPISPTAFQNEYMAKSGGLYKMRNKYKPTRANSLSEVVVHDTMTNGADKVNFLIYDNHRPPWSNSKNRNRVIVFASKTGLENSLY